MKKVIIIGCPGSGKSTFARSLYEITKLPLYHLDMMYWNPDKTVVEKTVFMQRLNDALDKKEWIIDGNYASTMELRMAKCDTVFFLDYSEDVCLAGLESRKGKVRSDLPWVEKSDDEDKEFIEFVKNYNKESRPAVLKILDKYSDKKIIIFKNRNEADEYIKSEQK